MNLKLSYKFFGLPLGSAPIVLVNHSLTGDAEVCGAHGWWSEMIGDGKVIDTQQFTILAFNFPRVIGRIYSSYSKIKKERR